MKKCTLKRRYLIHTPKEAVLAISAASSLKKSIYQLYCERIPHHEERFGVISARFDSFEQQSVFTQSLQAFIVADVSADKRYKNRYLSLFGLPQNYDFSLQEVFQKCDSIGTKSLELSFCGGMSAQKVMKVLMYRTLQFLDDAIEQLLEDEAKAPKKILKCIHDMDEILRLSKPLFDASLIHTLSLGFRAFLSCDREALLRYVQSQAYITLRFDTYCFLHEYSGFYLTKKSDMPLLFFAKKTLKKEKSSIAKTLKKVLD